MYTRHVVIYTSLYCWSTLTHHFTYTEQEIHKHCDVWLILLGNYRYAHVCPIQHPSTMVLQPFHTQIKDEDCKPKIKSEELSKCAKCGNVRKVTCHSQVLASKVPDPNISSSNIIADNNHVHNTRPSNYQRNSTKPLCESRCNINYA